MDDRKEIDTGMNEPIKEEISIEGKTEMFNPWRKPISQITWGLALTSFTLNFLLLQYTLPTIGILLLYLGFRSLRKENRWFYATWLIAAFKLVWQAASLVIYATPAIQFYENNNITKFVIPVIQITLLFLYRKALITIFERAGMKPARDPVLAAIIWTILIAACALSSYTNSWIVAIPLILFFILILRSLHKVGDDLSNAASIFMGSPLKINSKVVTMGYLISCLILVTISCSLSNHLKLDASEAAAITDSETRAGLIELGFPKEIIKDISDKDISMLKGATYIETSGDSLKFNSDNRIGFNDNLKATTVFIEFPDRLMYVIVYFDWKKGKAYWQDGFTIWGEDGFELLDGVLLYQKRGIEYSAPIPRLKCETVTSYNFFGTDESRQISGTVSYPYSSQSQRGYVFYRLRLSNDQWFGANCLNYIHYKSPLIYPYVPTEKRILNSLFNDNMKQHYTNFDYNADRETGE